MKLRFLHCFMVCVFLSAAILGGVKRQSYTDLTKEQNYLEQLQVAEIPEPFAVYSCSKMSQNLPNVSIILRISVIGDIEHLFSVSRQKVQIKEIYAGNGLEIGQELYVTSKHWTLSLNGNPNSIERGFINIMKIGYEYLIFISNQIESLNESVPIYLIYNDSHIAPIFCYENRPNVIVPTEKEHTYVPYTQVKDNEFFAESEVALYEWEKLKSEMLSAYPKNERLQ